jgi:hypothetical protein
MRVKSFACLAILLLLSAMLDDAVAAATVDTDDDVVAAENNVYLSAAPQHQQEVQSNSDLPLSVVPDAATVLHSAHGPAWGPLGESSLAAHPHPPSLYLLMSLQR